MSEPVAPPGSPQGDKPASSTPEPPKAPPKKKSKRLLYGVIAAVVIAVGVGAYLYLSRPDLPPGFAGGNGRLEANEVYVASKYSGRIAEVLANEGDTVEAG